MKKKREITVRKMSCKCDELKDKVLPLLRGHVFHVTRKSSLDGILDDGKVKNNSNQKYPLSFSQSKKSYAHKNRCVSLFDLRDADEKWVEDALSMYWNFLCPYPGYDHCYLILREGAYADLISWSQAQQEIDEHGYEKKGFTLIPHIECLYPNEMSIDNVAKIIEVKVTGMQDNLG